MGDLILIDLRFTDFVSRIRVDQSGPLSMDSEEPITEWLEGLRMGDQSAARKLWHHFVQRLCDVTRREIRPETRRVYDEDDAAQSAFHSLCAGVAAGRFPDLDDRQSLWRLLLTIASRKVTHRHRHDQQQRRDVRRNLEESIFCLTADSGFARLEQFASRDPTPEFQAEFIETSSALFGNLSEPALKEIASLKVEGYKDTEIAERLNCSRQSVQRKVERIRRNWRKFQNLLLDAEESRANAGDSGI